MCDCVRRPGAAPEWLTLCLQRRESRGGRHGAVGEPAQEDDVQGKPASRSLDGALTAPAGPGPTQPTRLPGRSEAPVQFPVAWRPPSPEMPVSLRRNPRFGAGASGGQRQSTKARSGGRLPPAVRHLLSGESLEQFVGAM